MTQLHRRKNENIVNSTHCNKPPVVSVMTSITLLHFTGSSFSLLARLLSCPVELSIRTALSILASHVNLRRE